MAHDGVPPRMNIKLNTLPSSSKNSEIQVNSIYCTLIFTSVAIMFTYRDNYQYCTTSEIVALNIFIHSDQRWICKTSRVGGLSIIVHGPLKQGVCALYFIISV